MLMTNFQLYLAVGLPTIAVLASMTVSLIQISGIRDDMRELRREFNALAHDVNTKIDMLTGKVYELMNDKH